MKEDTLYWMAVSAFLTVVLTALLLATHRTAYIGGYRQGQTDRIRGIDYHPLTDSR